MPSTHPLAKLCAKLLAGLPESGATLQEGDAVTLRRGHAKHKGLEVRSGQRQRLSEVVLSPAEADAVALRRGQSKHRGVDLRFGQRQFCLRT